MYNVHVLMYMCLLVLHEHVLASSTVHVHSVHSLQVHGNESQVFELCFSHNPKHIICNVQYMFAYMYVQYTCVCIVQYNNCVNKMSPYSNINYLSYTVSIV